MSKLFGFADRSKGSPHSLGRKLKEEQQKEMRANVERTLIDLRTRTSLHSGNIQNAIEQIHRIDSLEPVDRSARQRACRMLKMYLGQYRVLQVMRDHVEMVYSELEMREMTEDFAQSISDLSRLIQDFDRNNGSMPRLFAGLRKSLEPIKGDDRLKQYDDMYRRLIDMYPGGSDQSDISDEWLEDIVAGRASWQSAPPQQVEESQNAYSQGATQQADGQSEDIRGLMASLTDMLRGGK